MNIPYIAIDPTFPHHLNSFDNVPINYNAGDLVNITSKTTEEVMTYSNTINYTIQASDKNHTTFSTPLSNNKIILFICAI